MSLYFYKIGYNVDEIPFYLRDTRSQINKMLCKSDRYGMWSCLILFNFKSQFSRLLSKYPWFRETIIRQGHNFPETGKLVCSWTPDTLQRSKSSPALFFTPRFVTNVVIIMRLSHARTHGWAELDRKVSNLTTRLSFYNTATNIEMSEWDQAQWQADLESYLNCL